MRHTPGFARQSPTGIGPVDCRCRNVVGRRFKLVKQCRGLAARYDKMAVVYRTAADLHAVITWPNALSGTP
ncbi:hypothetical protein [Amycolatopsis sp. NPDC050768]|uniref:hypothetical protein n=1 Tax=Amycolatopsis sp. NPDC050768 TaxID=3154839 RepID=UPI00224D9179